MSKLLGVLAVALVACGGAGKDGEDGADGTGNRIVASHHCLGDLAGTALSFTYDASLMASGDVFVYASVSSAMLETGATSFYSYDQNGSLDAGVIFTADYLGTSNGGWWDLSLNRTTGVTLIEYNDSDASGGQDTWTMPAAACIVNTY